VVIPSVQGAHHLRRCLASLEPVEGGLEVIVVDSGSADGTRLACASAPPDVRLVSLARNPGFAEAMNRGLAVARGRYLLVLNNDVEVAPGALTILVDKARACGDVVVVPRILSMMEPGTVDNTGNELLYDGLNICRDRGSPSARSSQPVDPLLPSGCAMLLPASLLTRVGGFDPRYFAYGEDADLGLRAHRDGIPCRYAPEAVITHLGGGTWGADSLRKAYLVERNRSRMAAAHLPVDRLLASPLFVARRYWEHARSAATEEGPLSAYRGRWRKAGAACAAAAGLLAGVAGLPGDLRRRADLSAQLGPVEDGGPVRPSRVRPSQLRRRLVGRAALRRRNRW